MLRARISCGDGDPAVWEGRAPILFPVIGMIHDNRYCLGDREFPMPKHGFARDSTFVVDQFAAGSANLTLTESARTLSLYPFAFALAIHFAIEGSALLMTAEIVNRGKQPMPFSFGFHPAFRWPLTFGAQRGEHRIRFAEAEAVPLRRLDSDGFLTSALHDSPIEERILKLSDDLFVDDALIFEGIASRSVRYGVSGHAALDIAFSGINTLGVWTKPGAEFICIEPWAGISEPEDWHGGFRDKPGSRMLAPGETDRYEMTIALVKDFDA